MDVKLLHSYLDVFDSPGDKEQSDTALTALMKDFNKLTFVIGAGILFHGKDILCIKIRKQ